LDVEFETAFQFGDSWESEIIHIAMGYPSNERKVKSDMDAKDYFDDAADTWDDRFITSSLLFFLDKFVPQFGIEAGQKVLDVGTGTGVLIPYLVKAVGPSGSVTAIDFSEKMVQACKTKHSHFRNVSIRVGNIEDDNFPAQSFDAVICFGIFPHIENKEKALRNINNMLKPGGRLVVAHALSSKELEVHHKRFSEHVAHPVMLREAEMRESLERAGFAGIRIRDEPGCYCCISDKRNRL
jgi:demethylmenaquinone methyltransferase/2-methoxy-6-polyprenyl-1,4-benzoquinol methylase